MERRVEITIDPLRGEKVPVTLPLRFRRSVEETRDALGLAPSLDLSDPIVAKAVALAGAARESDPPVRFALFGGTAHRFACPASNDPSLGLRHDLHDLDVALLHREVPAFRRFLAGASDRAGSALTFFETSGDKIYNSLSGGQRLRWHMFVSESGAQLSLGTLDLVADTFDFCHRIDVRADVERAPDSGWTLSPAHLLLAKGQFIQRIPRDESAPVADRILEPFGKRAVVIGPEAKDMRDLVALLHDHSLGEGAGEISTRTLERELSDDWGLWKTFGLNLGLVARSPVLRDLPPSARTVAAQRLAAVEKVVGALAPRRRLGFLGGPWWQEVDSTPSTDAKIPIA